MKKYINGQYIEMTAEEIAELQKPVEVSREEQIEELKQQLAETNDKIIECYEYFLVGKPLPYDVQELHAERQSARNKIEDLEKITPPL